MRVFRLVALSAFLAGAGCGPIEYVNTVSRRADGAVEAARAVQAEKYSPYYFTLAREYLHKAREEAAYADFQAANRFGRLAAEAADQAREEALRKAHDAPGPAFEDGGLAPLDGEPDKAADKPEGSR